MVFAVFQADQKLRADQLLIEQEKVSSLPIPLTNPERYCPKYPGTNAIVSKALQSDHSAHPAKGADGHSTGRYQGEATQAVRRGDFLLSNTDT